MPCSHDPATQSHHSTCPDVSLVKEPGSVALQNAVPGNAGLLFKVELPIDKNCRLVHKYPLHGGFYLSAAAGYSRSLSPFCFKEPVNFALSLNYRWRLNYHHHFVRTLLERENLVLANIETANGGPAIPVRVSNLQKYMPFWRSIIKRQDRAVTHQQSGKSITLWNQRHFTIYSLPG